MLTRNQDSKKVLLYYQLDRYCLYFIPPSILYLFPFIPKTRCAKIVINKIINKSKWSIEMGFRQTVFARSLESIKKNVFHSDA